VNSVVKSSFSQRTHEFRRGKCRLKNFGCCGKRRRELQSQSTNATHELAVVTSLRPCFFTSFFLRRPRRLHLRRRRPIRSRSVGRLVPNPPHRRREPSARRHRIPSGTRVPHILALAQKIEHERNRREQQQQINERTRREVHCVVKNPCQQQDHSYDDEHGASNHPGTGASNFRLLRVSVKVGGFRLSPVQKKFSVVPRFAATAAWLGNLGAYPWERRRNYKCKPHESTNSTASPKF
jgi:hypothetical protein